MRQLPRLHALAGWVGLITCLMVDVGAAEPGPTVSKLMDTPASMFSFGIVQLKDYISKAFGYDNPPDLKPPLVGKAAYSSVVSYDWDRNRVVIQLLRFVPAEASWDYEEECRQAIEQLRQMAGLDTSTGKAIGRASSWYGQQFEPVGYSQKALEDVGAKMDEIIELAFQAYTGKDTFRCSAPLLGLGYSVQR